MTFHVLPKAEADLGEIGDYIAQDDPDAAVRLVESIRDRFRKLGDFPAMGRARGRIAPGMRSFPVGDYLIFYRIVKPAGVEIVRVIHAARDLRKLKI